MELMNYPKCTINQVQGNQRIDSPEVESLSRALQKLKVIEVGECSNGDTEGVMESLNPVLKNCLYSLGIFPEKTELKKTLVVYWWIGMGLLPWGEFHSTTAQHIGEILFSDLVEKGILKPVYRPHNKKVDLCTIEPTIHRQLISACKKEGLIKSEKVAGGTWHIYENYGSKAILNVDQKILNLGDINNMHDIQVVQLGKWCYRQPNNNHIEVDDTKLEMGKNVTYLSLQGISRLEELHESIGRLENLMILDLRACHNLEILPKKPRQASRKESWFKKLTHLDISECYLLDYMPKWICELSNLEVLKGFIIGSGKNKDQSCRLQDLSKLKKMRKLTMRIVGNWFPLDFSSLKPLDSLSVLTITWADIPITFGQYKYTDKESQYSFPQNLEKLDIRNYPYSELTELLNPANLKMLKRLYIRGGKITEIGNNIGWQVEILRLRYLTYLKIEWDDLKHSFENLKSVEYVECSSIINFPNGTIWPTEEIEDRSSSSEASG